jgi:hypothetical protein
MSLDPASTPNVLSSFAWLLPKPFAQPPTKSQQF